MKHRLAHFWYGFKNWFRTKPGPGEPLRFLCGSEDELRRVTTWICHFYYPDPFYRFGNMRVTYNAEDGFGGICYDHVWPIATSPENSSPLQQCLALASEPFPDDFKGVLIKRGCKHISCHNRFTGTRWIYGNKLFEPTNLLGIREAPDCLLVIVRPPSAHERAEALLALSEWLDGKVSEQEKCELLQLPDDVEI